MKRTIYIAGKVTGEDIEEVIAKFAKVQKEWTEKGYKVLNPIEIVNDINADWQETMKICTKALMSADIAYFLPDWRESKRAKLEYKMAKELGIKIIDNCYTLDNPNPKLKGKEEELEKIKTRDFIWSVSNAVAGFGGFFMICNEIDDIGIYGSIALSIFVGITFLFTGISELIKKEEEAHKQGKVIKGVSIKQGWLCLVGILCWVMIFVHLYSLWTGKA